MAGSMSKTAPNKRVQPTPSHTLFSQVFLVCAVSWQAGVLRYNRARLTRGVMHGQTNIHGLLWMITTS